MAENQIILLQIKSRGMKNKTQKEGKKMRKTVDVDWIKKLINSKLALDSLVDEEKQALALLLEEILFKTDNYKGFNNNYWREKGFNEWKDAGEPINKDAFIYGNKSVWDRIYF